TISPMKKSPASRLQHCASMPDNRRTVDNDEGQPLQLATSRCVIQLCFSESPKEQKAAFDHLVAICLKACRSYLDPKDDKALKPMLPPMEGYSGSIMDNDFQWTQTAGGYANKNGLMRFFGQLTKIQCSAAQASAAMEVAPPTQARSLGAGLKFTEMGIGQ